MSNVIKNKVDLSARWGGEFYNIYYNIENILSLFSA